MTTSKISKETNGKATDSVAIPRCYQKNLPNYTQEWIYGYSKSVIKIRVVEIIPPLTYCQQLIYEYR